MTTIPHAIMSDSPQTHSGATDGAVPSAAPRQRVALLAANHPWLVLAYRLCNVFVDPVRLGRAVPGLARYIRDWRLYKGQPCAEPLHLVNAFPAVNENTSTTPFDAHYFYQGAWAARRVLKKGPRRHVDVGSQLTFIGTLAASVPTVFVDIRPLPVTVPDLLCVSGDGLELPFRSHSVESLSCLHVAEHVGLGRYGDQLNALGTKEICAELARVVSPGGELLFSIPIGRPRVCFNAHRVVSASEVPAMFPGLVLTEFSAVTDGGAFVPDADRDAFRDSDYACGLFLFTRE